MTRAVIQMGGLSRKLYVQQSDADVHTYLVSMAGYQGYTVKADTLGEAVNLATVSIGNMRRDPAAQARASARMKKMHADRAAKENKGGSPAQTTTVKK